MGLTGDTRFFLPAYYVIFLINFSKQGFSSLDSIVFELEIFRTVPKMHLSIYINFGDHSSIEEL